MAAAFYACFEPAGDGLRCRSKGGGHWLWGCCAVTCVTTSCVGLAQDYTSSWLWGRQGGAKVDVGARPIAAAGAFPQGHVLAALACRSPAAAHAS